jgi:hypothetical protein
VIRRYCDRCEKQITRNAVSQRVKGRSGEFQAEVLVGVGASWNAGELCVPCVVTIVHEVAQAPEVSE